MAENLGEAVSCLSERASKRLLLNLLLAVRQAEKDPHEEKALIRKLRQMYRDVLATADRQPIAPELQHRWHLAFGDPAAGSLRVGLSDIGADSRRVCTFAPDLSVGPLMRLDEAGGAVARTAWLRQYRDGDDRAEAEPPFGECIEALRAIPGADSLMIWTADNAHDRTALALAAHLLRGREGAVRVINLSDHDRRQMQERGEGILTISAAELSPETFASLYLQYADRPPLDDAAYQSLAAEWQRLSAEAAVLRIWKGGRVQGVRADYFDATMMRLARRLLRQRENRGGLLCVRLVGETIGLLREEQWVDDTFIFWRVRCLIRSGKLSEKKVVNRCFSMLTLGNR